MNLHLCFPTTPGPKTDRCVKAFQLTPGPVPLFWNEHRDGDWNWKKQSLIAWKAKHSENKTVEPQFMLDREDKAFGLVQKGSKISVNNMRKCYLQLCDITGLGGGIYCLTRYCESPNDPPDWHDTALKVLVDAFAPIVSWFSVRAYSRTSDAAYEAGLVDFNVGALRALVGPSVPIRLLDGSWLLDGRAQPAEVTVAKAKAAKKHGVKHIDYWESADGDDGWHANTPRWKVRKNPVCDAQLSRTIRAVKAA